MPENIRLKDGDETTLTYAYDNVTYNKARQGWTYYIFTCEEGKYSCNNHCVRAVQQAWPGRGGSMHIKRLDATAYEITDVVMGTPGDLVMKKWEGNEYVEIPFDLDGIGEAAPVEKPPPQEAEYPPKESNFQRATNEGETMEDLVFLMGECMSQTGKIWADYAPAETSGDIAGAIERMAVSLYIDCRKMGITGMPVDQLEEEGQVRVHVEGGELVESPPMPTEPPNPGTEEDDDLPF
jgi:hypothetical protein